MKSIFAFFIALFFTGSSFAEKVSCSYTTVSSNISSNTSWSATTVYDLAACVHVTSGTTLTIPAGTHIIADAGSALIIDPGARLIANGTSLNPIVFSSSEVSGDRVPGDWDGLVLLGNGRTNANGNTVTLSDRNCSVSAGDTTDSDSSGSLQYVRIEYATTGFTALAVGSRTVLAHIQSSFAEDEAFRFAGGRPVAKDLVAYNFGRTGFLMDYGNRGKYQFLIALQKDPSLHDASGTNAMVISNNNSMYGSTTAPEISNATLYGISYCGASSPSSDFRNGMLFKEGAMGLVKNNIVTGFPMGVRLEDNATLQNARAGDLIFDYNSLYDNTTDYSYSGTWPTAGAGCGASFASWITGSAGGCTMQNNELPAGSLEYSASICSDYCDSNIPSFLLGDNDLASPNYGGFSASISSYSVRGAVDGSTEWTEDWSAFCPQGVNYCQGAKSTSVQSLNAACRSTISLFPNPAMEQTTVKFTAEVSGLAKVLLLNSVTGQVVWSHDQVITAGEQLINLDLRGLPVGVYIVHLKVQVGNTLHAILSIQ